MGRPSVWRRIEAALSDDLSRGLYRSGEKLPTEAELTARFGVSRNTVRKALAALETSGEVTLRPGAGAFAASRAVRLPLTGALETVRALRRGGAQVAQRLVAVTEQAATQEEARALGLAPGSTLVLVERMVTRGNEALWLALGRVHAARFPDLAERVKLGEALETSLADLTRGPLDRTWTGMDARNALPEQAELLDIQPRDALLHASSAVTDPSGCTIALDEMWFVTGRVMIDFGSRGIG